MPAASKAARNKASRIRKKIELGKTVTPEQSKWLADYEAAKQTRTERPPDTRRADSGRNTPPDDGWVEVAPGVEDGDARPSAPPSGADVPITFGSFEQKAPPMPDAPPSGCDIKDCPACRAANIPAGGKICVATGKRVWPPMTVAGSKAMARSILMMTGFAIKLFRADGHYVTPNDKEIGQFADALREVSLRRAGWMGAFDDLFAFAQALGQYGARALTEKPPKADLPPPTPIRPEADSA